MRYSRVLLVIPPYSRGDYGAAFPLAGVAYIAQSLKDSGFDCSVMDMKLGYNVQDLLGKIQTYNPSLIGMSLMTLNYNDHYNLTREIKGNFPEIKVLVGGPHVSTMREDVLKQCAEIDYGIVLEGEESIIELCKEVELAKIKGLIYRKSGEVVFNGERQVNMNLDKINFPRYEGFELAKYVNKRINISTSRGCPFNCIYCAVNLAIGKKFRARSAQSVLEEIKYWRDRGYRQIGIIDDNFTLDKERVYQICDGLKKVGAKDLEFICDNGIRADRVDRSMLKTMKEAGFRRIAFGVEGGNDKMMKVLKRGVTVETIERSIKDACELGYDVILFFLIGSPCETLADIEDSAKLAMRYPIFDAVFGNLIPYPRTELFDWVEKNNYFLQQPAVYLNSQSHLDITNVFYSPELDLTARIELKNYLAKVRRKVRRRYIEQKLTRLFFLKKIISRVYVNDQFQRWIHFNKRFRHISEKIYSLIGQQNPNQG